MRIKALVAFCAIVSTGLVSSCKDDVVPEQQFSPGRPTPYSLKGANLYLIDRSITNEGREFLTYTISDGTYTNNSGCEGLCLDDYNNGTYFIHFKLGSVVDGDVTSGKFRMHFDQDVPPANSTMCYVRMEHQDGASFRSNANEPSPLIISGGLKDGQKMTIKFNGNLLLNFSLPMKCNIYYSGTVIDVR